MSAETTDHDRGRSENDRWTFRLDGDLADQFDEAVEQSTYVNRSEAIRNQIRQFVAEEGGA
ncbi:ribbon-helix-helix domain-containing protein [Halomarina salina]|uniref:Ribbon-helix-helix domain-containing protein n=1 Tax=Halomarina salina TaxID=1872699 RepID=A0ABD5RIM8_9EURY|nr:ribbon-helix-helix domain-containing protein [Halomarina salina]